MAETADLGGVVGALDPPRQVAGSDHLDRLLDRGERTETDANDRVAEQTEKNEDARRDRELDEDELVQGSLQPTQGNGDHDDHRFGEREIRERGPPREIHRTRCRTGREE